MLIARVGTTFGVVLQFACGSYRADPVASSLSATIGKLHAPWCLRFNYDSGQRPSGYHVVYPDTILIGPDRLDDWGGRRARRGEFLIRLPLAPGFTELGGLYGIFGDSIHLAFPGLNEGLGMRLRFKKGTFDGSWSHSIDLGPDSRGKVRAIPINCAPVTGAL
jgi:hypothetical protein